MSLNVQEAGRWIMLIAASFLERLLTRIANQLWDAIWEEMYKAVAAAQVQIQGEKVGDERKRQVMDYLMNWLTQRANLSFTQKTIARFLISTVVDGLVGEVNERMGHDWVATAKEMEKKIADKIPFIE